MRTADAKDHWIVHAHDVLGAQYGVELPIATQMAEVLAGRTDVRTAVDALMLRRQRPESESG